VGSGLLPRGPRRSKQRGRGSYADETWAIRYMEVATRNWLPGKMVVVLPEWIEGVSWEESKVRIALSREAVKEAPEYVLTKPMTRDRRTPGRVPLCHLLFRALGAVAPSIRRTPICLMGGDRCLEKNSLPRLPLI